MTTFQQWLKLNDSTLRKYTALERGAMAISCGFKPEEVPGMLLNHLAVLNRKLTLWESPFHEHWLEVWGYQKTGTEFTHED